MQDELHMVEVRYTFDEDEINQLGREVAGLTQEQRQKEAEKKHAVSVFTAEINSIKKTINNKVDGINNGYEMREVQTKMVKNYSTQKREFWDENGNIVKEENFKPGDSQRDIDLEFKETRETNGEKLNDLFSTSAPAEKPVYLQLWYSQALQQQWVTAPDGLLELPIGDDWNRVGIPVIPDIIADFQEQHQNLRGSLATVKEAYELFQKAYHSRDDDQADESTGDEPTEPTSDGPIIGPYGFPVTNTNEETDQKSDGLTESMQQTLNHFGASELTVTGTNTEGETVVKKTVKAKRPKRKKYILQSKRVKPETAES